VRQPKVSKHESRQPQIGVNDIDKWIQRLAHLSQVGLLLLTVFGFFYTVIPLYQKAALDEAISKDEARLKALQITIDSEYAHIRDFATYDYVASVGPACTGLLLEPPLPTKLMKFGDAAPDLVKFQEKILDINVDACLHNYLNTSPSLKQLHPSDFKFFEARVAVIGNTIERSRKIALQKFFAEPNQTNSYLPSDTQNIIVDQYGNYARNEILKLKSVNWNDVTSE